MGLIEAIVLGLVQGLTEFLPISSTAHIRIVPAMFGWDDPGAPFTAAIQLGTLAALLLYFAKDIIRTATAWAQSLTPGGDRNSAEARLGWAVLIGTVPIVIGGVLFKDSIETGLRSLYVISGALILVAGLMAWAEKVGRKERREASVIWLDGLVVGLFQAAALIPGVSRSGATISGGLLLGFDRGDAARFSFFLSIPSVLAAGVYSIWKHKDVLLGAQQQAVWVANGVSFVSGYLAIAFLLSFLKRHGIGAFVVYRVLVGLGILAAIWQGWLTP